MNKLSLFVFITIANLAIVFIYYGFIQRKYYRYSRIQVGAVVLTVLSFITVYHLWLKSNEPDELAKYIRPYSKIDETTFIPGALTGESRRWMFKTSDRPSEVAAFYRLPENHEGWRIEREHFPFMWLRSGKLELLISAAETAPGETTISYELKEAGN